jgi:hypothetical protein
MEVHRDGRRDDLLNTDLRQAATLQLFSEGVPGVGGRKGLADVVQGRLPRPVDGQVVGGLGSRLLGHGRAPSDRLKENQKRAGRFKKNRERGLVRPQLLFPAEVASLLRTVAKRSEKQGPQNCT